MFENLSDRIAGSVLLGLDVAVEFATLGEFRLVDPDDLFPAAIDTPASTPRKRLIELDDVDRSLLPQPSTALARAAAPAGAPAATRSVVVAAPCEQRRRADAPTSTRRATPRPRQRTGAPKPPAQLCLLVD